MESMMKKPVVHKDEIQEMQRQINEIQIACASKHADVERVVEWLHSIDRKPANTAFTLGPERVLGYWFEQIKFKHECCVRVQKERDAYRRVATQEFFAIVQPWGEAEALADAEARKMMAKEGKP